MEKSSFRQALAEKKLVTGGGEASGGQDKREAGEEFEKAKREVLDFLAGNE